MTDYGGISLILSSLLTFISNVFEGKRQSASSIAAKHQRIVSDSDWDVLLQEVHRPIVVVGDNTQHLNFWRSVCGEGLSYVSHVQIGDKSFVSPWATQEFHSLHNSLVVSRAEPDENDLELLEMQEALEDYVVLHGLYAQAAAASRLASRQFDSFHFLYTYPCEYLL